MNLKRMLKLGAYGLIHSIYGIVVFLSSIVFIGSGIFQFTQNNIDIACLMTVFGIILITPGILVLATGIVVIRLLFTKKTGKFSKWLIALFDINKIDIDNKDGEEDEDEFKVMDEYY